MKLQLAIKWSKFPIGFPISFHLYNYSVPGFDAKLSRFFKFRMGRYKKWEDK
jgi:hypothetical protein